jgi:hypothetical protein
MLSLKYASNFCTVSKNNIKLCLKHLCKHFTPSTGNLAEENSSVSNEGLLFGDLVPTVYTKLSLVTFKFSVAAQSEAWTAFAHSNAGIVGLNPTQGMDVCVCIYSVFVLSCVYVVDLWQVDHPSKEPYHMCKKNIMKL